MTSELGTYLYRYSWLFAIVGPAIFLLVGRARAAPLVAAGRVSEDELSGFVRGGFLIAGFGFLLLLAQKATIPEAQFLCSTQFPPTRASGWVYWTVVVLTSSGLLYWVWARGGDDLLARLAPAFTQGPVLERSFSRTHVRLLITLIAVVPLLANIAIQVIGTGFPMPACAAG